MLGFSKPAIEKALRKVLKEMPDASVEKVVKRALKEL